MTCLGSYDSITRTLTHEGEFEPTPGVIMKVTRITKFNDADNYQVEWRRSIDGKEVHRTEARHTRIKSGK